MRYTVMMIALAGVLHAQQPAAEAPPAPAQPPGVEEPKPQPPAANQQPAKPGAPAAANLNREGQVLDKGVIEPDCTGDRIAELYREYTGKRVIVTRAAIAKSITFVQQGRLTYKEAADLLEKTALLEGLVFVPSGENEVKLVVAQNGKGVPVITQPFGLPKGDQVVTYVMNFTHISPDDAIKVFQSVVKNLAPNGSLTPVANTKTLLITENSALIRRLIDLRNQIDISQEVMETKTIRLEHGDAEQVAEEVQTILDFSADFVVSTGGGGTAAPPSPGNNNRSANNNRGRGNQRNSPGGESGVLVRAIPRLNSIMVIARPVDIKYAEGLISDFDQPSSDYKYYRRRLHFIAASDFLGIARNAIQRTSNSLSDEGGGSAGGGRRGSNQNSITSGGATGSGQAGTSLAESERSESPEDDLTGKTHIIANNAINTIIVAGPRHSVRIIDELINEMDVASEQVQITAIFGRYNLTGNLDFGVDFYRTYQSTRGADSGFAIGNSTGYPVLIDPTTLTDAAAFNTADVSGLSIYGKIGEHFLPTLRALEGTGRFKVLARPTVFTTNNKKAILSSGQSVAVPTNSLSTNTGVGGNVSQSTNIEFKDVLLKLEVVPLVNSENEVTLRISFINDTIVGSVLVDGNEVPTIGKEELVTQVTVPNKGTVVLGGLITERNSDSVSGVPILSRIPGLGKLFSTTSKEDIREELVIFIQPRIVSGKGSLAELQEYNRSQSRLAEELVPETGLLPPLPTDHSSAGKEIVPAVREVEQPAPSSATQRRNRFRGLRR